MFVSVAVMVILSASVCVKVILSPALNFISSYEDDAPVIVFLNIISPVAVGGDATSFYYTKLRVVVF